MTKTTPENNNIFTEETAKAQEWLEEFHKIKTDKLFRGKAIENIEQRCLALVQSYIGGSWSNATSTADISVVRISGGFTNQLYQVQLKESVPRVQNLVYPNEPTEVAIKLYQSKHIKNYHPDDPERLNDTIVINSMSQAGLGPKVYGIFENGFIQDYHEHEQFRGRQMEQPELRKKLMSLLARIAHLKVPIRKEPDLILAWLRDFIAYGYEHFDVWGLAKELKLKHLSTVDVVAELDGVNERIKILGSPVVFAHNDFRGSNVLVTTKTPTPQIFACDVEHAGYGSRGYDLATIFWEWGKKGILDMYAPPPTDENLRELVTTYIACCDEVEPGYSSKKENSPEAHIKEVKLNALFNMLFFAGFLIGQKEELVATMPIDRKKNLAFAETVIDRFLQHKATAIEEGYY